MPNSPSALRPSTSPRPTPGVPRHRQPPSPTSPVATPTPDTAPPEGTTLFTDTKAYSGIAVRDMSEAREFYGTTLGLRISEEYGLMWLHLAGGRDTLVYEQPDATPASYTILNFEVDDIDETVDALAARGVRFERYNGIEQDDRSIVREEGPYIAWFKD